MNQITRKQLHTIFGKGVGDSIAISLSNHGVKSVEKVEYKPCVMRGKETTMRQHIRCWDIQEAIDFYLGRTDNKYKQKYAHRAKILKGLLDDN